VTDKTARGFCDIHSHLFPAVDDGAQSLEDAEDGLCRMSKAGIDTIVTTPHLLGSLTLDDRAFGLAMESMDRGWKQLSRLAREEFPDLALHRGQEVMLDVPDVRFDDARTRLAGTSFALVEWPRLQVPPGTLPVLQRLKELDVRPIIAHPERYAGIVRDLRLVQEWKRAGARLQVNLGSLVGRYGPEAREGAFRLLELGWIDYLASDFHARPHLKLYLTSAREVFERSDALEQFERLTCVNPARILDDEEPLPVDVVAVDQGFWDKLRNLISRR
jgi:protein-tyrosine phosphatase